LFYWLPAGGDSLLIATSCSVLQSAGFVVISARKIKKVIDQFLVGDLNLVFTGSSITTEDREIPASSARAV
jgi:hypothetical protein